MCALVCLSVPCTTCQYARSFRVQCESVCLCVNVFGVSFSLLHVKGTRCVCVLLVDVWCSKKRTKPMTKLYIDTNTHTHSLTHTAYTSFSHHIIEKLETKWMRYNWIYAWRLCQPDDFMCEKSKTMDGYTHGDFLSDRMRKTLAHTHSLAFVYLFHFVHSRARLFHRTHKHKHKHNTPRAQRNLYLFAIRILSQLNYQQWQRTKI